LQISGKWTMITRDGCSFADYNIHKHATLDIKLLHPTTEPRVDYRLLGGADDSASALQDLKEHGKEEEEEEEEEEKEEEDYTSLEEEEDYTFKDEEGEPDEVDEANAVEEFMEVTGESEDDIAVKYLQRCKNHVGDACALYCEERGEGKGKRCKVYLFLSSWQYPP